MSSTAIGSCIVVLACNVLDDLAVMAHVMLPGRAALNKPPDQLFKYTENALEEMLNIIAREDSDIRQTVFLLAGGGNVLRRDDDSICLANIASVENFLNERHLNIVASELGGFLRRSVRYDIGRATAWCTEGDGPEKVFWEAPPRRNESDWVKR